MKLLVLLRNLVTIIIVLLSLDSIGQTTQILYLSGTGSDDTVEWEFMVSGGRNSNEWSTIPVPSNWEMQGFGTYRYFDDWSSDPVPDSVGNYRYRFDVPASWSDKKIDIVFGGSMTDTEVKVNGLSAGPKHQGGFYEFRYDITDRVKTSSENLLEVKVSRFSTNRSVNLAERQADFWQMSGIYRPVWLEAFPQQHIERTAIDARHTGLFSVDVFLDNITTADRVSAQIVDLNGDPVGEPFSVEIQDGQETATLQTKAENIKPWSSEWPNRYRAEIRLEEKENILHEITETFGFRTIEVRPKDGLYVNDVKVRLKGVNRHSSWPTTGRATNKTLSIQDITLIKEMNMNAARMSHYPPDTHFLEAADSLGLYIIDELTGWQAHYDTDVGTKLVQEMIIRDVNHPSVIFWANGNEGGFNNELVDDYAEWDPQKRTVIHPQLNFNGINTAHYQSYDCCPGTFFHGDDLFMPTEFLHGLYDGGHGAGLEDWWNLMLDNPLAVGGFLWAFADEGIVREDRGGAIDTDGNRAPDGIVGPYREKEGSFYAIKEIWSPVYFELNELDRLPPTFSGNLRMENRYDFTDLNQITFSWQLADFPTPASGDTDHDVRAEDRAASPDVPPQNTGTLTIDLPEDWQDSDALYLTATDPFDRKIYTWSWMIPEPETVAERIIATDSGKAEGTVQDSTIVLRANNVEIWIDINTGILQRIMRNTTLLPLSNGPRLVEGLAEPREINHHAEGTDYVVEIEYDGNMQNVRWQLFPSGWLRLEYSYRFRRQDVLDYLGVTFDFPEDQVTGIRWLGRGPYRVWKNRLKGAEFNVWQKEVNDAMTGHRWEYPEFKGFHDDVYWATLETKDLPITMVVSTKDLFLRLFTPKEPEGNLFDPRFTHVDFPPGDLSLLHAIAPIGSKFHPPEELGPAGQPNTVPRLGHIYEGTVYFYFGEDFTETQKQ